MTIDADPRICLSLLYKNDPFYSLCLSDLMTAPQWVKNKFLKEQRNLTMTLKKLELQKLTRLRQLNEEQTQFGLLMKRKLVPRVGVAVKRGSSIATERNSPRTLSSVNFALPASSKSSWKSFGTKAYAKPDAGITSTVSQTPNGVQTPTLQSLGPLFPRRSVSQHLEISTQRAAAGQEENATCLFSVTPCHPRNLTQATGKKEQLFEIRKAAVQTWPIIVTTHKHPSGM